MGIEFSGLVFCQEDEPARMQIVQNGEVCMEIMNVWRWCFIRWSRGLRTVCNVQVLEVPPDVAADIVAHNMLDDDTEVTFVPHFVFVACVYVCAYVCVRVCVGGLSVCVCSGVSVCGCVYMCVLWGGCDWLCLVRSRPYRTPSS